MARRVKVTFFINSLEQGGAERQLAELVSGLDRSRFEPSLVLCVAKDQLGYDLDVGAIRSLDAPMFPSPASVMALTEHLRALRPDVLHTYMGWENVFGRVAARAAGVRAVVSSVRCTRLPRKHVLGEVLTNRLSDAIIVNSVGIRDELVARARVPRDRIDVVENGVDLDRFRPLTDEERVRERSVWGMDGRRALVVPGRICAQKNQLSIVRALAAMKRSGTLPPDPLVIFAGRDNHVTYGPRVRALVSLAGLGPWVRFVGVVKPIERLVGAADGVLLPSHYEGLPNAVIESMATAAPVIVSPPANTDRLVTDGVEGLLCRDQSPGSIARAVERFCALKHGELRAMGERGAAHARQRFTVARMVAGTVAIYSRILGEDLGLAGRFQNGVNGASHHPQRLDRI